MSEHFPARYAGAESEALLHRQQRERRLLAQCRYLATMQPEHLVTVAEVDAWLLEQAAPEIFDEGSPANVLTQHRRRFGQLCAALTAAGYAQPQLLPLYELNCAVDYLNTASPRKAA